MMAAPTNNAHVSESLTQLETAGGATVACRLAASFTQGMDIPAIRRCLGEVSRQVLETEASSVADGFLSGIGQDRPQQAVNRAVQAQCEHEDKVANACQSVEIAADGLQKIDDQCAQTVAQMCTAAARAVDTAKAFAGPVQGALLSQPLVQVATELVERLLSSRNISLEGMLEVLINDHVPAAQCGSAQTPVCVSPTPDAAPAPTPVDERDCGCDDAGPSVEPAGADCAKPSPVMEEPPLAQPECEEAITPASTPTTDPAPCPSTSSSASLPDKSPMNSHPVPSDTAPEPNVADTSCAGSAQTVVAPAQACDVAQSINANVNANINASLNLAASVAGSASDQFFRAMDGALCPQEGPPASECTPPEPMNAPPTCSEEPVCEHGEAGSEPEPRPEPVSSEPCTEPTKNAEPVCTDRPEDLTGEDVPPEGFDKSKQPSVPDGAVTVPDPIEPDGVDRAAQAPAVDESTIDEPVNQVTEVPQQDVQQPSPEPVAPETAPASETWTPDIWVSAGADVDMEVELASSANAVPIARSGQW